jgi:hypothetical protein
MPIWNPVSEYQPSAVQCAADFVPLVHRLVQRTRRLDMATFLRKNQSDEGILGPSLLVGRGVHTAQPLLSLELRHTLPSTPSQARPGTDDTCTLGYCPSSLLSGLDAAAK